MVVCIIVFVSSFEIILCCSWMCALMRTAVVESRQQRGESPGKKPLPPPNAVLQADAGAYGHPQPSGYGSTHGVGRSNSYAPDYNKPPSYPPYGYPPPNLQPQYSGRGAYGYPSSGASSPPYNYPPSGSASPPTAPTFGDESPQRREDTEGGQVCCNFLSARILIEKGT